MPHWLRYEIAGTEGFGTLSGDTITEWQGDMFSAAQPTERRYALADVRLLTPCRPGKMIGLWNNFHERAVKEGLQRPSHPLYFLKSRKRSRSVRSRFDSMAA